MAYIQERTTPGGYCVEPRGLVGVSQVRRIQVPLSLSTSQKSLGGRGNTGNTVETVKNLPLSPGLMAFLNFGSISGDFSFFLHPGRPPPMDRSQPTEKHCPFCGTLHTFTQTHTLSLHQITTRYKKEHQFQQCGGSVTKLWLTSIRATSSNQDSFCSFFYHFSSSSSNPTTSSTQQICNYGYRFG